MQRATRWFDCGEHPTLRVRTRYGFELTGTPNHPVLVCIADGEGKPRLAWKTLDTLQVGDYLVIDRGVEAHEGALLDLTAYYPTLSPTTRRHTLPAHLDESLAFLMGALVAEGTLTADRIEFTCTPGEFADEFVRCWTRVFPDCRLHQWLRPPVGFGKRPFWQMQVVSQQVVRLLHALGLQGRSAERTVPEAILRSPRTVQEAFLRGLFEGDGCVERSGRSLMRVSLVSASKRLLQQVQVMLLHLGIVARLVQDRRGSWRLMLTGSRNIQRYAACIGFVSEAKRKALTALLNDATGRVLSKSDYVPYLSAYVRRAARRHREWLSKHNFDRPERFAGALPRLLEALSPEDAEFLCALAEGRYFFDPVVAIEDAGIQRVYSIRVASACHSFVANGFINHTGKLDGITDIADYSDRTGMRVVIELRRDVNPNRMLNSLLKHTQTAHHLRRDSARAGGQCAARDEPAGLAGSLSGASAGGHRAAHALRTVPRQVAGAYSGRAANRAQLPG
jgi:DNA gyrase subunit A